MKMNHYIRIGIVPSSALILVLSGNYICVGASHSLNTGMSFKSYGLGISYSLLYNINYNMSRKAPAY